MSPFEVKNGTSLSSSDYTPLRSCIYSPSRRENHLHVLIRVRLKCNDHMLYKSDISLFTFGLVTCDSVLVLQQIICLTVFMYCHPFAILDFPPVDLSGNLVKGSALGMELVSGNWWNWTNICKEKLHEYSCNHWMSKELGKIAGRIGSQNLNVLNFDSMKVSMLAC